MIWFGPAIRLPQAPPADYLTVYVYEHQEWWGRVELVAVPLQIRVEQRPKGDEADRG